MKSTKYICIALFLLICFSACKDDEPTIDINAEISDIQTFIEEGNLLKKVSNNDENHILTFETGTVTIPSILIGSIKEDLENWTTLMTFANKEEISIPTLGNNLDNIAHSIELNPSGFNPLAAEVFTSFPVKGRAKIIVHSKEGKHGTIEYLFKNYGENHNLIILGLYPDYENQVSIVMTDKNGNERSRTQIKIKTKPLDISALPNYIKVKKCLVDKMEPGMNLLSDPGRSEADTSCPYMIDADGEIRWVLDWSNSPDLLHAGIRCGLHRMKNGNFWLGDGNNYQACEINILGEVVRKIDLKALGYNFHHETIVGENGELLIAVTKLDAKLANGKPRINDHIIEMDQDGSIINKEWDLAQVLDTTRYFPENPNQTRGNWVHNNALLYQGDEILASGRHQGVFKFKRNGELTWILSPHKGWSSDFNKHLLTPLDKNGNEITDPLVISGEKSAEDFDWSWAQHNPVIKPNGNILVFDNGQGRNFIYGAQHRPERYSRIVEYEIDETNMTVKQVWQFGKGLNNYFANQMSSVQYLPKTENVIFGPGTGTLLSDGTYGGHMVEIDPKTDEIIFEMEVRSNFQRAIRLSLYPEGM